MVGRTGFGPGWTGDFTTSPANREYQPRLIVQVREDACLVQTVNHYRLLLMIILDALSKGANTNNLSQLVITLFTNDYVTFLKQISYRDLSTVTDNLP